MSAIRAVARTYLLLLLLSFLLWSCYLLIPVETLLHLYFILKKSSETFLISVTHSISPAQLAVVLRAISLFAETVE